MRKIDLNIPLSGVILRGDLILPRNSTGIVLFAHGSGSSRLSPRNRMVEELIPQQKTRAFLFDLITKEEDEIYENRFNIDLLSDHLIETTRWILEQDSSSKMPVAFFGASIGAHLHGGQQHTFQRKNKSFSFLRHSPRFSHNRIAANNRSYTINCGKF